MSFAVLLACGCSSTAQPARTACNANVSNVAGTTSLMSAEIPGPAPKVGKAHLAVDEADSDAVDATSDVNDAPSHAPSPSHALSQPKEARPSDGSRRGGGFGTSSK
jgi:hypothetical protein